MGIAVFFFVVCNAGRGLFGSFELYSAGVVVFVLDANVVGTVRTI